MIPLFLAPSLLAVIFSLIYSIFKAELTIYFSLDKQASILAKRGIDNISIIEEKEEDDEADFSVFFNKFNKELVESEDDSRIFNFSYDEERKENAKGRPKRKNTIIASPPDNYFRNSSESFELEATSKYEMKEIKEDK